MPWITPTVFKQAPDESLVSLQRFESRGDRVRFWHLLHPYGGTDPASNRAVQSITFETIRSAMAYSPEIPTQCVAVTFPEDADLVPAFVSAGPCLERDVSQIADFAVTRRLPLLFDVLRSGAAVIRRAQPPPDAITDYVVLTNSDIHVQPFFYAALEALIASGYDAMTVNRRTIGADADRYLSPLVLADQGTSHPGFDCFVFPLRMMDDFVTSDACCGAGGVMRSLLFNLVARAERFLMLTHTQMTFHLGDDRYWRDDRFRDYQLFNYGQTRELVRALLAQPAVAARLTEFIQVHENGTYLD